MAPLLWRPRYHLLRTGSLVRFALAATQQSCPQSLHCLVRDGTSGRGEGEQIWRRVEMMRNTDRKSLSWSKARSFVEKPLCCIAYKLSIHWPHSHHSYWLGKKQACPPTLCICCLFAQVWLLIHTNLFVLVIQTDVFGNAIYFMSGQHDGASSSLVL